MNKKDQLDVVVRFHDLRRLSELERCIFSLVGQNYRPLHIIVVLQRFAVNEVEEVRAALSPLLRLEESPDLSILNWSHEEPADARSALLNLGLSAAQGRYLAFLDYDDAVYPEGYELLIARLRKTEAAIVFGSVRPMRVEVYETFVYAGEVFTPNYAGSGLTDLFEHNFCPLHSYLIDRQRVPASFLFFEPFLTIEEDYDLLLRICAQFPSDFSMLGIEIGEYFYKTDGSNTVATVGGLPPEKLAYYNMIEAFIEQRRRMTPLSAEVQRALGFESPVPQLTIRDFLDNLKRK